MQAISDLPRLSDPASPFYNGPPIVVEGPVTQPSAAGVPPAAPASASPPPPLEQTAEANPDGITVQRDDGTIVQSKPDGDGGTVYIDEAQQDDGDSNNQGNSKNRTGGNDKEDDKKGNNSSGGGGCCGSGSGGGKHK